MKNTYSPIITTATKENFFDYIESLQIPQIDYFAIGLQNKAAKNSISLMSKPEWQKQFVDNNYAAFDPIRRVTLQTNRNIIPINEIDHLDNLGKEIMRQRARLGIKTGIILMERFSKHNYMITLGTSYSKFDAFEFLKKYHSVLSIMKQALISIIEKDMKNFLQI